LQLNDSFINFLKSCSAFQLKQTDKGWGVTVRKGLEEEAIAQPLHSTE
jgi:hypothetical protein